MGTPSTATAARVHSAQMLSPPCENTPKFSSSYAAIVRRWASTLPLPSRLLCGRWRGTKYRGRPSAAEVVPMRQPFAPKATRLFNISNLLDSHYESAQLNLSVSGVS
ncbi:hypothetical protein V7S43_005486 [Phytophthora oleae]|uniref:Uncharacterized protein n=1 Tax=Phytophthora oleae TaxID=2107226 RepID=A0ABD3FRU6_9STRA